MLSEAELQDQMYILDFISISDINYLYYAIHIKNVILKHSLLTCLYMEAKNIFDYIHLTSRCRQRAVYRVSKVHMKYQDDPVCENQAHMSHNLIMS